MHPLIKPNGTISENIKIIKQFDGKPGISSPEESEAAKAFFLIAKPKNDTDGLKLYDLRQEVYNYDTIGESGFLLHYARKAYRAVKNYLKSDGNSAQSSSTGNNVAKK